jgi:hypothetical protein
MRASNSRAVAMDFTTTKGREVYFEQLHIRDSSLEVVYKKPNLDPKLEVHYAVSWISRTSKQKFGQNAVLLPPPSDRLPPYTLSAGFASKSAVQKGDCSFLVVVWFEDTMPTDIRGMLEGVLRRVDWDANAVDGDSADE